MSPAGPAANTRHPTMAALLAELTDTLPRPRSAWLVAAAVSAALTSVTWALLTRNDDPSTSCAATVAAEVDALWGPTTRASVHRAFAATQLPYAGDSFARSARLLDAHLDTWAALRQRTCELAPNPDTPAPGARCLDRHRRRRARLAASGFRRADRRHGEPPARRGRGL